MRLDKTTSKILIVDDNPVNIDFLVELLKEYDARTVLDGPSALEAVLEEKPDVILLDIGMPGMDGFEVCNKLKASAATKDIPIIFLSAHHDSNSVLRAFEAGGVDYIAKPYNTQEVLIRLQTQLKLKKAIEKLKHLTLYDELTGVANRKKFFQDSQQWITMSKVGIPFYLFILTIDHFNEINDDYGYDVGDEVIKAVVLIVKKVVKTNFSISRFGGTEFFLVFTRISEKEAIEWVEAVKEASKKARFKNLPDLHFIINSSFAVSDSNDTSINQVIKRARDSRVRTS
jgi:two-component system glycerol uptake and utilization response regulator